MRLDSYRCDHPGCGKIRGEVNRWWVVFVSEMFEAMPFNDVSANDAGAQTYCGEEHVMAAFARFLQDGGK